jgi:hypothetical protein
MNRVERCEAERVPFSTLRQDNSPLFFFEAMDFEVKDSEQKLLKQKISKQRLYQAAR